MPIYEYSCQACGHEFEEWQKISDPPPKKCPKCGAKKLEKLISRSAFHLKGGGWYSDLYGSAKAGAKADPKGDATAEAKVDAKTDAKAESKTEAKAESKTEAKSESKTEAKATTKKADAKSTKAAS